jgi:hypothetical protein
MNSVTSVRLIFIVLTVISIIGVLPIAATASVAALFVGCCGGYTWIIALAVFGLLQGVLYAWVIGRDGDRRAAIIVPVALYPLLNVIIYIVESLLLLGARIQ